MRDNDPTDHTAYRSHKQALEQYGFLLQWFVGQAEKVAAGQAAEGAITAAGKRVSIQQFGSSSLLASERGRATWTAGTQTRLTVRVAFPAETDQGCGGQEGQAGGVYVDELDPGHAQRDSKGVED